MTPPESSPALGVHLPVELTNWERRSVKVFVGLFFLQCYIKSESCVGRKPKCVSELACNPEEVTNKEVHVVHVVHVVHEIHVIHVVHVVHGRSVCLGKQLKMTQPGQCPWDSLHHIPVKSR